MLKRAKNLLTSYWMDEEGQTSTEYILLVAVVALIVFKFKKIATARLAELTGSVFDKADSLMEEE